MDAVLVKPVSDSSRGKSVRKLGIENQGLVDDHGRDTTLLSIAESYKVNFLLQEYVRQHECTGRFNESSLNVLRVITYRRVADDKIIPLQVLQNAGNPGSHMDHGGIIIGLDEEGRYRHKALFADKRKYDTVNGIALKNLDPFPFMKELAAFATDVAGRFIHSRVLGLDLGVDREGKMFLVEANTFGIGIENPQHNNGPLFREYTEEVIDFCRGKRRTFAFFFDL